MAIKAIGGTRSQTLSFSFWILGGAWPNTIAVACLKNPINKITISAMIAALITGWLCMRPERMNILVKKMPKGGAPVIAKTPVKKSTAVTGAALIAPVTAAIFAE